MPEDEDMTDTPGLDPSSPFSTLSAFSSPPKPHDNFNQYHQNPRTPPQSKSHRPRHAYQHTRSPSLPLSLHHVGIGAPSPLLRQLSQFSSPRSPDALGILARDADDELSSPGSNASPDSSQPFQGREVDDLTQDRKDVLVERLSDLMRRLQRVPSAEVLDELHLKVDELEEVLGREGTGERRRPPLFPRGDTTGSMMLLAGMMMSGKGGVAGADREGLASPPWLETRIDGRKQFSMEEKTRQAVLPDVSERVVAEVESLNSRLMEVAQSLKARKEETDVRQSHL